MTAKEKIEFEKKLDINLRKQFNEYKINCISKGFCSALTVVKKMLKNGESKSKIIDYCDLIINNTSTINNVANKKDGE